MRYREVPVNWGADTTVLHSLILNTLSCQKPKPKHKQDENMPYDNKRINGPDSSISYLYHSKANLKTQEEKLQELFKRENDLRIDGRRDTEARKICTCSITSNKNDFLCPKHI